MGMEVRIEVPILLKVSENFYLACEYENVWEERNLELLRTFRWIAMFG